MPGTGQEARADAALGPAGRPAAAAIVRLVKEVPVRPRPERPAAARAAASACSKSAIRSGDVLEPDAHAQQARA